MAADPPPPLPPLSSLALPMRFTGTRASTTYPSHFVCARGASQASLRSRLHTRSTLYGDECRLPNAFVVWAFVSTFHNLRLSYLSRTTGLLPHPSFCFASAEISPATAAAAVIRHCYFLSFFSRNCSLLANAFYFLLSQCCSPLLTILYCSHTAVLMRPNVITSIVTIAIAAIATMVIFVISHFRKLTIARSAGSQRAVHVHMGRVHHHLSQRRPRRR
jgi:hypothetical protein